MAHDPHFLWDHWLACHLLWKLSYLHPGQGIQESFLLCAMRVQHQSEACWHTLHLGLAPTLILKFLTWVLGLWLWIPSAWIFTLLSVWSVDTEVLIPPALHGCWALLPQLWRHVLRACTCCFSSTITLTWTLSTVLSAWIWSCLSVLPHWYCLFPSPLIPRILASVSLPGPKPSYTPSLYHWPHVSSLLLQCLSSLSILLVPVAFPSLSHPAADHISTVTYGIDFQGKNSICFPLWFC